MGKIYIIIGKSASGKDTVYNKLLADPALGLKKIIPYTTRPRRSDEDEGVDYFFCDDSVADIMGSEGKIIESRTYDTVHGKWRYFTADDGQIDIDSGNYITVGTPASCVSMQKHFGRENVMPIYIKLDDGARLARALRRERKMDVPRYSEMCRRFLADEADFSDENLKKANLTPENIYINDNSERTAAEIAKKINA